MARLEPGIFRRRNRRRLDSVRVAVLLLHTEHDPLRHHAAAAGFVSELGLRRGAVDLAASVGTVMKFCLV